MAAPAQTSARHPSTGKTCTVTLAVEDAIGIGYSIRALVKQAKMPSGTAETYLRVAQQLIAAAKLEVVG
jgi:hypothetical protein